MIEDGAVEYFLNDIGQHGRNRRTTDAYRRVLTDFEMFISENYEKKPTEVDYRECMAYIHELRASKSESTVATYASYLNRFYTYLIRVGKQEENPMSLIMDEMEESIDSDPERRDISLQEMRQFLGGVEHPLHRTIMTTLLKTGMRSGELCNLDLVDIHFKNVSVNWSPRAALSGKPDSLYVSSEHTYGEKSNGELRTASNKRKRNTTIPIDDELREELQRWLTVRPDTDGLSDPLFVGTTNSWGQRITPDVVHHIVESHTRDFGWHRKGGSAEENVTPHYFRHFFTTHLRDRIGDRGIVKYLRGDVGDDIIDTYTHDWGDRVQETYLNNIYTLFPNP
jgi:integrase